MLYPGVLLAAGVAASPAHGADARVQPCALRARPWAPGTWPAGGQGPRCLAEAKGMGISIGDNGTSTMPMETVKTLLDHAVGRLP